jgi:hypothetical protein
MADLQQPLVEPPGTPDQLFQAQNHQLLRRGFDRRENPARFPTGCYPAD